MVLVKVVLFKDRRGTKLLICVSYSCEFVWNNWTFSS